jgi:endoglucanase
VRVAPPASPSRLGFALAAWLAAFGACHGPDPYYRNGNDGGAGASVGAGAGGKGGATGVAGKGAAGSGAAGTGAAGTSGAAGTGANVSGAAGTGGPCTTCKVTLQYTCRSDDKTQASFVLNVTNNAAVPIPLADLTLRYWYTREAGKDQALECDFAELGCSNQLAPKFMELMPARDKANYYVEIGFTTGALTLDPFLDTGEIQLRVHNKDFTEFTQTDDYSFDASQKGNPVEWKKITAYIKGVLVWGTEPL